MNGTCGDLCRHVHAERYDEGDVGGDWGNEGGAFLHPAFRHIPSASASAEVGSRMPFAAYLFVRFLLDIPLFRRCEVVAVALVIVGG